MNGPRKDAISTSVSSGDSLNDNNDSIDGTGQSVEGSKGSKVKQNGGTTAVSSGIHPAISTSLPGLPLAKIQVSLDKLLKAGSISDEKGAFLMSKSEKLYELALKLLETERKLVAKTNALAVNVRSSRVEYEKAEADSIATHKDIYKLQRNVASKEEEMATLQDRVESLVVEMNALQSRKEELTSALEDARREARERLLPRLKVLTEDTEALKGIVADQEGSKRTIQSDLEAVERQIDATSQSLQRLKKELAKQTAIHLEIKSAPEKYSKHAELMIHAKTTSLTELDNIINSTKRLKQESVDLNGTINNISNEIKESQFSQNNIKSKTEQVSSKTLLLESELTDSVKSSISLATSDIVATDIALSSIAGRSHTENETKLNESKKLSALSNKLTKAVELNQYIEKEEISVVLKSQKEHITKDLNDVKASVSESRKELDKNIQVVNDLISSSLIQNNNEQEYNNNIENYGNVISDIEGNLRQSKLETIALHRRYLETQHSLSLLTNTNMELGNTLNNSLQMLESKDRTIIDLGNSLMKMNNTTLSNISNSISIARSSRDKLKRLLLSSQTSLSECKSRLAMLTSEVTIMDKESSDRERILKEEVMRMKSEEDKERRSKASQAELNTNILKQQREKIYTNIEYISSISEQQKGIEADIVELKASEAFYIQKRNEVGLKLIDSDNMIEGLLERKNKTNEIINEGRQQQYEVEEQIKNMKLLMQDLRRRCAIEEDKHCKEKDEHAEEIRKKSYELSRLTEINNDLEMRLENVNGGDDDESRRGERGNVITSNSVCDPLIGSDGLPVCRKINIEGSKVEIDEETLVKTAQDLTERYNASQERLLERQLVLQEITRLTNELKGDLAESQLKVFPAVVKANRLRTRGQKLTRKMVAVVAELSMLQATAMRLREEHNSLDAVASMALKREAANPDLPPTDDCGDEWMRSERRRLVAQQMSEERRLELAQERLDASGTVISRAPQRNDEYLVRGDPTPKAFGAFGEFMPTQTTGQLWKMEGYRQRKRELIE